MKLTVNSTIYEVENPPAEPLLWVLRDTLGLTGTKFGCGAGICGACAVQVDGAVVRSCVTPLEAVSGKEVRTIEGLARETAEGLELHPVQQAFFDERVPQCSWCMSGQMMTAAAFLERTPSPTEAQITEAMTGNYCRCGCYVRIRRAVAKAAEKLA